MKHERKSMVVTELSRHLHSNPDHCFIWKIIYTSKYWRIIGKQKKHTSFAITNHLLAQQASAFFVSLPQRNYLSFFKSAIIILPLPTILSVLTPLSIL